MSGASGGGGGSSSSSGICCQIRTGVLSFAFFLGTAELTLWVMFYTFRLGFRETMGYNAPNEEDLVAASVLVTIDIIVNVLLICGANKDYSGRRKDLRRWGFMVPWVLTYAMNILLMFSGSIVMFYSLPGGYKALGLFPMFAAILVLGGHFMVLFFMLEQRADLDIYMSQHRDSPS